MSETSGHFKRLLVSLCQVSHFPSYFLVLNYFSQGNRDESTTVDVAKAKKEANDLYQVFRHFSLY